MGTLRIGELARRTALSPEVLRAWERRYGLLRPSRSAGGYRLYSEDDAERVLRMQELISSGIAAAEAARLALDDAPEPSAGDAVSELRAALDAFDDAGAHRAFDGLLARLSVEAVLADAVLPLLRELGERWEMGEASVAKEHFASQLLRGRLLGLARGWDRGVGPRAVLACAPGEQHDLPLIVFGLALRSHGWRITFLGADTPIETIADTTRRVAPEVIVLAMLRVPEVELRDMRELTRGTRVLISGRGASSALARELAVEHFAGGPIEAAAYLADA